MKIRSLLCCALLCLSLPAWGADIPVPVAADSRIKTLVYSENDVFDLVTHYGYQSNIEFGIDEEIQTISVGDRVGWQISPAGRRLFIRAMTTNAHTNMTVITNRHAYQFDLIAMPAPISRSEEIAYVVRFFYPDDKKNAAAMNNMPAFNVSSAAPAAPAGGAVNYNYTFTGSDAIAPVKLFDDGNATYFKFRAQEATPAISLITGSNKEVPVAAHRSGEYWVVDTIGSRFIVRQGNAVVCVYNEKLYHP